MSPKKPLLLIAIGLAIGLAAGYTNQARQAAYAAKRASANTQPPETIGAAAAGYRRSINRSMKQHGSCDPSERMRSRANRGTV